MSFAGMFFYALILFSRSPVNLVLKNGGTIPLNHGWKIDARAFQYRDARGESFLVPMRLVDLKKTFAAPEERRVSKNPYDRRRDYPWDHPDYRDKMTTTRVVEILNRDLKAYTRSRRKKMEPNPEAKVDGDKGPGTDEEKGGTNNRAPAGEARKKPVEDETTGKETKGEEGKAQAPKEGADHGKNKRS